MTGAIGAAAARVPTADEPPVVIDRVPAREAAERELSKEIYTQHEPNLFQRVTDWILDRLAALFDGVAIRTPGGWLGLVVLTLVVVTLLIALRLHLGSLKSAAGRAQQGLLTGRPRSAAEHRAAADRLAAADDWDRAVQERMRALVRSLEERALLDPRPGRTADEAAVEAGTALPALAGRLRAAARTFDDITYGDASARAEDHTRLRELDEELRRTRPQPVPAGGAAR